MDNDFTPDNNVDAIFFNMTTSDNGYEFSQSISTALSKAETELMRIDDRISETEDTLSELTPECDKLDYILAVSSGALCGIIDIFLVGKPGESPLGEITDKWFEERTKDFAKLCKLDIKKDDSLSSVIQKLEKKFKIPYDQTYASESTKAFLNLSTENHHFKSLGHNPSLVGLFFSILDQFIDENGNYNSHFVSGGELVSLKIVNDKFILKGNDIPSKLFCAFINWFGHLMSDISGSSSSKGRGMGIPSPLWTWTNDVIAIKRKLGLNANEFDNNVNELAIRIYKEGYDIRFQAAQAIPVFINEMIVRVLYSVRRLIRYFINTDKTTRSFSLIWKSCEPFTNATVKRMLTVAHGTFCMIDIGDATIRSIVSGGGNFNVAEFIIRLNLVGIGRFSISIYGEVKRGSKRCSIKDNLYFLKRERIIIQNYIEGLQYLSDIYDDQELMSFIEDLKRSDMYIQAFEKTVLLAEKRQVPDNMILKTKSDIDNYFQKGMNND